MSVYFIPFRLAIQAWSPNPGFVEEEQRQDRLPDGERGYRVLGNEQMAEQCAVIGERGNDGIMLARVKPAQRAERRDRAGLRQDRRYALIQTLSDVLAENGGVRAGDDISGGIDDENVLIRARADGAERHAQLERAQIALGGIGDRHARYFA